jgi:lysophospholipase L1-like esterase
LRFGFDFFFMGRKWLEGKSIINLRIKSEERKMIRILFQGDSITDGNRYKKAESRWDLNHQIGHSYVFNIASHLGLRYPGRFFFINRGVSGDSVDKARLRWELDVLNEHPDVLSVLLGINGEGNRDGYYPDGAEAHLAHFDKTYRELLDLSMAQNPSLKLILIEPFFLPVGKCKEHYDDFMSVFRSKQQMIKKIADDYGATFIPVQKPLEMLVKENVHTLAENGCDIDPYAYWLWDGIHPTEAMHGFLAKLWLDAAKSILGFDLR